MAKRANPASVQRGPDVTVVAGAAIAAIGILAGLLMEGGRLSDVCQLSAGFIVLGGTIGAVVLTTPGFILRSALGRLKDFFSEPSDIAPALIEEILRYAWMARRGGLASLEEALDRIEDPFFRKALTLAIDETDAETIRHTMELELNRLATDADNDAGVFEAAGGYAPTIGIIGAVIGLIQVMKHLDSIAQIGPGIAVAFVATLYGVGSANLCFLPAAQKIRFRFQQSMRIKELILEGVIGIRQGLNPRVVRGKLEAFVPTAAQSGAGAHSVVGSPEPAVPGASA